MCFLTFMLMIYIFKITINVEEMVREARYENGAFDKAANSFKPKPSLSAIYLYPALAMSYCTQHNTVGVIEILFSQVTCSYLSEQFRFVESKSNFIPLQSSISFMTFFSESVVLFHVIIVLQILVSSLRSLWRMVWHMTSHNLRLKK